MIHSLRGKIIAKESNYVVLECGGVGFFVKSTFSSLSSLGTVGSEGFLYTHFSVREDAMELFGFSTQGELNCFTLLLSVNGVGPKLAVSLLSDIPYEQFIFHVAAGDSKSVTKAKGVGTKLAQRIVLELKDKFAKAQTSEGLAPSGAVISSEGSMGEALAALTVLGYDQSDVMPILATLSTDMSSSELIKNVLKTIGKKLR